MPPPSCCSKINNTRSANDHENENDFGNTRSEASNCDQDLKKSTGCDTVGIVKSLLGPSLEDTVLRTLEFGRSLMQKSDLQVEQVCKEKKSLKKFPKELAASSSKELNLDVLLKERSKDGVRGIIKKSSDKGKKVLAFPVKTEKEEFCGKTNSSMRKLSNVSKIRSLDSDLKQSTPSPEKIKKQLEALIQINKDEPPEHTWNVISTKKLKIPGDMTVMPSLCMYKNEADMTYSSSCDVPSQSSKLANDCNETTSRMRTTTKKRSPKKMCQAPEFLSNALGPTIDVSIIDNLKMMRDIFKYDTGIGEGSQQIKQEIQLQNSELEMACRIEELQKKIEELEEKEQCLIKQIEEEEQERQCKRLAFEEEQEKRLNDMKALDGRRKPSGKTSLMENLNCDTKSDGLHTRIANEEEKLLRLKHQHEQYKRELLEVKNRKQALKRNKCLLDAWDIFASRVCHTRLPSFSRAYDLERKEFKSDDVSLHCCFPTVTNPPESPKSCCGRSSSRSRCPSQSSVNREHSSHGNIQCKIKMGEIQFPIQRDIVCGLHQMLKTCSCSSKTTMRVAHLASSEDDLLKKYRGMQARGKSNFCSAMGLETSAEMLVKKAVEDKHACRSKSDTSLKNEKCSKIVKVMWAVARINIFQNNYRTYEIMDATCTPPSLPPARTEGIFVVKAPHKKCTSRPQCGHSSQTSHPSHLSSPSPCNPRNSSTPCSPCSPRPAEFH